MNIEIFKHREMPKINSSKCPRIPKGDHYQQFLVYFPQGKKKKKRKVDINIDTFLLKYT